MKKETIVFFVFLVTEVLAACPSIGNNTYWRVSIDPIGSTVYYENLNDTSGYYSITNNSALISTFSLFLYALTSTGGTIYMNPSMWGSNTYTIPNYYTMPYTYPILQNFSRNGNYSFNVSFTAGSGCFVVASDSNFNPPTFWLCPYNSSVSTQAVCNNYSSCYPCDCACKNCVGPDIGTCTSCKSGYYLQPPFYFGCETTCPYSYYGNPSTGNCSACYSRCLNCTGPASNQCISCFIGYYYWSANSSCLATCPSSYYADPSTITCQPCNSQCTTCFGPGNYSCSSCASGYYLQNTSSCLSTCPAGTWTNATDKTCHSCSSGTFLQPSSTTCSVTCPNGYWPDSSNNICSSCNSVCSQCTGPTLSNCTLCNSGSYLLPTGGCSTSCPTGYYQNTSNYICSQCNLTCSACSSASSCTQCASDYYLQPTSPVCLVYCPQGYYHNRTNNSCLACQSACLTCSGPTVNECYSCQSGFYLDPTTNTCGITCPQGYYQNSTSMTCIACYAGCSVCTGNTKDNCTSCNSGFYLEANSTTCTLFCASGYWEDASNNLCSICKAGCQTCMDSSASSCTSCSSGYYLQPDLQSCLNTCPSIGYWPNSANNICSPCDSTCSVCTGNTFGKCSSCSAGFFLQPGSTICLAICPSDGYWADSSTNTCSPCSQGCATCNGSGTLDCTSCSPGFYLQPSENQCGSSCSIGFYENDPSNICSPCNENCANCQGNLETQCITCKSGYFKLQSSNTCVDSCPSGYYDNSAGNLCSACDSDCYECTGPTLADCVTTNKWAIWTMIAMIGWFFFSVFAVVYLNATDYCLLQKIRESIEKGDEIQGFKRLLMTVGIMHYFTSAYLYTNRGVGRVFRLLITFVRINLMLLLSSFLINDNTSPTALTFSAKMKSFDVYLFLIPIFGMMPLDAILDKILRASNKEKAAELNDSHDKYADEPSSPSKLLRCISVLLLVILALGTITGIVARNLKFGPQNQALWQANFLKIVLEDLFLCPIMSLLLNYLTYAYLIQNLLLSSKITRKRKSKALEVQLFEKDQLDTHRQGEPTSPNERALLAGSPRDLHQRHGSIIPLSPNESRGPYVQTDRERNTVNSNFEEDYEDFKHEEEPVRRRVNRAREGSIKMEKSVFGTQILMIPDNFPGQNGQENEQSIEGGGDDDEPPRFDQAIPDYYYGDYQLSEEANLSQQISQKSIDIPHHDEEHLEENKDNSKLKNSKIHEKSEEDMNMSERSEQMKENEARNPAVSEELEKSSIVIQMRTDRKSNTEIALQARSDRRVGTALLPRTSVVREEGLTPRGSFNPRDSFGGSYFEPPSHLSVNEKTEIGDDFIPVADQNRGLDNRNQSRVYQVGENEEGFSPESGQKRESGEEFSPSIPQQRISAEESSPPVGQNRESKEVFITKSQS